MKAYIVKFSDDSTMIVSANNGIHAYHKGIASQMDNKLPSTISTITDIESSKSWRVYISPVLEPLKTP